MAYNIYVYLLEFAIGKILKPKFKPVIFIYTKRQ